MALLAEQDFASISVGDICERAMVHRTTFYKHYQDKHDLLVSGMRSMHEAFMQTLKKAEEANDGVVYRFMHIFEFIAQHRHFYQLMFCGDGITSYQAFMRTHLASFFEARLRETSVRRPEPAIPLPLIVQFCAGTIISTTAWWLDNDMPYSAAEMAQYVSRLLAEGAHVTVAFQIVS